MQEWGLCVSELWCDWPWFPSDSGSQGKQWFSLIFLLIEILKNYIMEGERVGNTFLRILSCYFHFSFWLKLRLLPTFWICTDWLTHSDSIKFAGLIVCIQWKCRNGNLHVKGRKVLFLLAAESLGLLSSSYVYLVVMCCQHRCHKKWGQTCQTHTLRIYLPLKLSVWRRLIRQPKVILSWEKRERI